MGGYGNSEIAVSGIIVWWNMAGTVEGRSWYWVVHRTMVAQSLKWSEMGNYPYCGTAMALVTALYAHMLGHFAQI